MIGVISLVHVRFGILSPMKRSNSAESRVYEIKTRSITKICAGANGYTITAQAKQKIAGKTVRMS